MSQPVGLPTPAYTCLHQPACLPAGHLQNLNPPHLPSPTALASRHHQVLPSCPAMYRPACPCPHLPAYTCLHQPACLHQPGRSRTCHQATNLPTLSLLPSCVMACSENVPFQSTSTPANTKRDQRYTQRNTQRDKKYSLFEKVDNKPQTQPLTQCQLGSQPGSPKAHSLAVRRLTLSLRQASISSPLDDITKCYKRSGLLLGMYTPTKTDEFSEKFRRGFDPPHHFWKIMLRIS